jgi:hypothetical protein
VSSQAFRTGTNETKSVVRQVDLLLYNAGLGATIQENQFIEPFGVELFGRPRETMPSYPQAT